nr:hypothetical protein [Tanacetum cinerariifolium]
YKQAKGGDVWLITVTWAEFKKLFFLQFFPRAEQERLKREYHSIRQTNTETSTEFMNHFLRLAGSTLNHLMCMPFTDVARVANAARNYEILHERDDDDAERPDKRRVVIGISRPLNRVVTRTTVTIMTIMDQTGEVIVTTTAAAPTTTLATTTGILVMGVTRETGVSSPTDLPILVPSSPGVPLRVTPTRFALRVDADTQESVVELLADKKPGASGRVFAITEDHATKTSGFLATIYDTTSDVSSIHDQLIVFEFPDVFPDELLGIPSVREVEFNIELILRAEPISKAPYHMAPIELKELKDQ